MIDGRDCASLQQISTNKYETASRGWAAQGWSDNLKEDGNESRLNRIRSEVVVGFLDSSVARLQIILRQTPPLAQVSRIDGGSNLTGALLKPGLKSKLNHSGVSAAQVRAI